MTRAQVEYRATTRTGGGRAGGPGAGQPPTGPGPDPRGRHSRQQSGGQSGDHDRNALIGA